jgi:hypothetical protein
MNDSILYLEYSQVVDIYGKGFKNEFILKPEELYEYRYGLTKLVDWDKKEYLIRECLWYCGDDKFYIWFVKNEETNKFISISYLHHKSGTEY